MLQKLYGVLMGWFPAEYTTSPTQVIGDNKFVFEENTISRKHSEDCKSQFDEKLVRVHAFKTRPRNVSICTISFYLSI